MKKRAFTLLEMMVGIALLLMISGVVSWNIFQAVKKYRFSADVSKIEMHLFLCHRLALNTGVDLTLQIEEDKGSLYLQAFSIPKTSFLPKPLKVDSLKAFFNEQELGRLVIQFSPTGYIEPLGQLEFYDSSSEFHRQLDLPTLFHTEQLPDQKGPTHPEDF